MKRLLVSILAAIVLTTAIFPVTAFAASEEAISAANALHDLGLFNGTGTNSDGTPNFDLDRAPTRNEAVTMLVRLLGKEEEAKAGTWNIPFTDVPEWVRPYVGYAYEHGLTTGTSATTYSGSKTVTVSQYLTFVLRSLNYTSGTDFQWDKAWELSDRIGLTKGQYNANTKNFTRGDVAIISNSSLSTKSKESDTMSPDVQGTDDLQGVWQGSSVVYDEYEYIFTDSSLIFAGYADASIGMGGFGSRDVKCYYYQTGTYQVSGDSIIFTYQYQNAGRGGYESGSDTRTISLTSFKKDNKKVDSSTLANTAKRQVESRQQELDTDMIFAKLVVPHIGASNNDDAYLIICNNTGHTVTLKWMVSVNGYLCHVLGNTNDVELKSGYTATVHVTRALYFHEPDPTMYLDNDSRARFTIEFNGKSYQGECGTNGNPRCF